MNTLVKFFGGWILAAIATIIINFAILGAAVWIVVKILQAMGVL